MSIPDLYGLGPDGRRAIVSMSPYLPANLPADLPARELFRVFSWDAPVGCSVSRVGWHAGSWDRAAWPGDPAWDTSGGVCRTRDVGMNPWWRCSQLPVGRRTRGVTRSQ